MDMCSVLGAGEVLVGNPLDITEPGVGVESPSAEEFDDVGSTGVNEIRQSRLMDADHQLYLGEEFDLLPDAPLRQHHHLDVPPVEQSLQFAHIAHPSAGRVRPRDEHPPVSLLRCGDLVSQPLSFTPRRVAKARYEESFNSNRFIHVHTADRDTQHLERLMRPSWQIRWDDDLHIFGGMGVHIDGELAHSSEALDRPMIIVV